MESHFWDNLLWLRKQYAATLEPVCRKWSLTRNELDVLLFLANNSQFDLAVDIVRVRKMQKSHVSLAVNKLCEKGYIQKETDAADRKKVHLKLEESASEIIRFGQDCQRAFGESLFSGISREDREEFLRLCELIRRNVTEK